MQLMPGTAKRYGVENVFDPEQNLRGGAKYLRDLLEKFGSDARLAIAAYQAGELNVIRYQNSIPPFRTTIEYVSKVLDYYHKFRAAAGH
jgi:soluble lytic murein transglycosylase-like protein